ncbi:MAG: monovalent cation/H+ antiporter subunit D family protein [Alphaproteobacteria bacterium]|nr:monovalent cation/H+ antiporter subunit D family protein [Alphaproteobacteria bacterium]
MLSLLDSNLLRPQDLICVALAAPVLASFAILLCHRWPNLREAVTLIAAATVAWAVWSLAPVVMSGGAPTSQLSEIVPGLSVAFRVEPFGMVFALVAGTLWLINSLYSFGYMRANNEPRQTSFYVCFAVAIAATLGLAFAGNLLTLFICYEILTVSTYPLVTHKATPEAMRAGRVYLLLLLGTSMLLLLPAIIATYQIAGTLEFQAGGILAGKASGAVIGVLLALYVFGIGKAALMPFHAWLPNAMVAPTPVSALLHAVAVVKAGVFSILKVVLYVFGLETVAASAAQPILIAVAMITLVFASLIALTEDNLKARLAYSTVSQLAYIVLGALMATSIAVTGAGLHIATHAAAKITLFFCAGAIYVAHNKTLVSQLDGLGRLMPLTMGAFLVASLSLIGLPPLGGLWSKALLMQGALDSGEMLVLAVLMLSSLLSVAYLMPVVARAFFRPLPDVPDGQRIDRKEAPWPCVVALLTTAVLAFVLFFAADALKALLEPAALTPFSPEVAL